MENAPFFDDIADGPAGTAHWITTADGLRIRVAHWTGADVKGTVLLFPGRTEYIEKYGTAAAELLARGYASIVIDWRGQGLADRTSNVAAMGDVAEFSDYQDDVTAAVAHARALNLPEPFYLLAHSMGGCIGLRALHNGLPVAAAAFSAPMWGVILSPVLRPFAWIASTIATKIGKGTIMSPGQTTQSYVLRETFEANTLTNDPDVFATLKSQLTAHPELGLGGPSLRWLNRSLREMRRLSKMPSPDVPCCTFLGTSEAIVDPERIHIRMDNWSNGTLHMIEGGKHEVMMEAPKVRTHVFDTLTAHFDQHR